jgi:hypothetical protein
MNLVPRGAKQQQQQCDKLLKRQLKLSVSTRRNKIPMKSKESSSPQGIPRLLHTVAGFIFVFLFFWLAAFRVVFSLLAFVFDVSHIRVQKAKKKKLDLSYASVAGGGGGDQNGRIYLTAALELVKKKKKKWRENRKQKRLVRFLVLLPQDCCQSCCCL